MLWLLLLVIFNALPVILASGSGGDDSGSGSGDSCISGYLMLSDYKTSTGQVTIPSMLSVSTTPSSSAASTVATQSMSVQSRIGTSSLQNTAPSVSSCITNVMVSPSTTSVAIRHTPMIVSSTISQPTPSHTYKTFTTSMSGSGSSTASSTGVTQSYQATMTVHTDRNSTIVSVQSRIGTSSLQNTAPSVSSSITNVMVSPSTTSVAIRHTPMIVSSTISQPTPSHTYKTFTTSMSGYGSSTASSTGVTQSYQATMTVHTDRNSTIASPPIGTTMMQSYSTETMSAGYTSLHSSPIPTHQSESDNEHLGLKLWELLAAAGAVVLVVVLVGILLLVCIGVLCSRRKKKKADSVENDPRSKGIQLLSFITVTVAKDDTDKDEQEVAEEKVNSWNGKDDYQRRRQDDTIDTIYDDTITLTTFGLPSAVTEVSQAPEMTMRNKQPGIQDDVKRDIDPHDESPKNADQQMAGGIPVKQNTDNETLDEVDKVLELAPDDYKATDL